MMPMSVCFGMGVFFVSSIFHHSYSDSEPLVLQTHMGSCDTDNGRDDITGLG